MRKLTEQDLTALVGSVQSGYTILRARVKGGNFSDSDHYGIALGRNAVDNYVTWQFHLEDKAPSMYWGHYTDNEEKAITDYEARDQ